MVIRLALYCVCDHENFLSFYIALFFNTLLEILRNLWGALCRRSLRINLSIILVLATATLGLGSFHQKPRVGGTLRGSLRDGSDGWRSPVSWGDNTGGEFFYPFRQPSLVGLADWFRAL